MLEGLGIHPRGAAFETTFGLQIGETNYISVPTSLVSFHVLLLRFR